MARDRGTWFEKQENLGIKLGFSDRQIRRHSAECESLGWFRCDRTGRSSLFTMGWHDRSNMSGQENARPDTGVLSDRTNMAGQSSRYLIASSSTKTPGRTERTTVCLCGVYFQGEERVRCECGSIHDPELAVEVDPIQETGRMLFGYVQQCRLQWPEPDEEICIRTLNAAGGSLVALRTRLRFLLLDRRQAPTQSYAWFPAVCASETRRSA